MANQISGVFLRSLSIFMLGIIISGCAGSKPVASGETTTSSHPTTPAKTDVVSDGMVPIKTAFLDMSYPKGWKYERVVGNPVVKAKIGDMQIFCFKESGLTEEEAKDAMLAGMREAAPSLMLVSTEKLNHGGKYFIHEGHVTAEGREITLISFVGLKLEGNNCGYGMFFIQNKKMFNTYLEAAILSLESAK